MENLSLCHSLLDDEGIPRNGPFAPLSLADRIVSLVARYRCQLQANKVLRQDLDEAIEESRGDFMSEVEPRRQGFNGCEEGGPGGFQ